MKPNVLVFSGYGLNCEEETKFAFDVVGASSDIVHINDIIDKKVRISDYQILAIGGGFAYGDDTGAGNAYANKMKNHLWEDISKFLKRDKLIIGICNGFQVLVNLGLLPALSMEYGLQHASLMPNEFPRYTVRFVDLEVKSSSPWLTGIRHLAMPISSGEGKLFATENVLSEMNKNGQIALKYIAGDMCTYLQLPKNPNGSIEDIAGITDETGRVLGLMPHPERAMFFTQLPDWQIQKTKLLRRGLPLPDFASNIKIFENAVSYF